MAYLSVFYRCERPDYALRPGEYCYSRVRRRLKRSEFYFNAGQSTLKGYYYPADSGKDLVVICHGFHSGADDFLPMTEYLVKDGFNVFCYDGTGSYDSKGKSLIGMCQPLVDLDNVLNYLENTIPYKGQNIYLIGHSLGGYAVTSALAINKRIKGCVALASVTDGAGLLVEKSQQYIGKIAWLCAPFFGLFQKILFGKYTKCNGVKGVNSTTAPVLIVQGVEDRVVPYKSLSFFGKNRKITNQNVKEITVLGLNGSHNDLWCSERAIEYRAQVVSGLKLAGYKKGKRLTYNEKSEYFKGVDNALYSQINAPLMQEIVATFKGSEGQKQPSE